MHPPEKNSTFVDKTNASNRNFYLKSGAEGGIRTHTPLREADFKSPKAHSPSGNVHLVNSFVSDRRLRGLSPRPCQFYEGYLTRFVNTIYKPLLDISKNDIATVLGSLACNAGGKHAYFRVLPCQMFGSSIP